MTAGPGIEPGPHWWEASALTTAPSLLPKKVTEKVTPRSPLTVLVGCELHKLGAVQFVRLDRHLTLNKSRRLGQMVSSRRELSMSSNISRNSYVNATKFVHLNSPFQPHFTAPFPTNDMLSPNISAITVFTRISAALD